MSTRYKHKEGGRTVMEVLFVLVIVGVLVGITALSFSGFKKGQSIPNAVEEVVSLLNEARTKTLAGENGDRYGVHLQGDRAVLFVGTTYSSGTSTNRPIMMPTTVTISSISLAGGGADVVFDALTGETAHYGTLIVKDSATTIGQKTITISRTGLISTN